MVRLLKYCKGYLRIKVCGLSPERLINLCGNRNILLWDLCRCNDEYVMFISIDDYRCLRPLLRKTKTKASIVARYGLPFFLYRYRKRKLFAVGIVFCLIFLFVMSGFIWEIEIDGNYTQTDDILNSYLEENAIVPGMKKNKIDCEQIEKMLRQTYDDIIWTSVRIEGTALYIQVKENQVVKQEKAEAVPVSGNIIADCDGKIAKIITRAGIPQVVPDTEVKKGDLLVSGTIPIKGDDGTITGYQYATPDADILMETKIYYEDEFALQYQEKVYTGKEINRLRMGYDQKVLYLPTRKNEFTEYDMVATEYVIPLFKEYKSPMFVGCCKLKEYYTATKKYEEEQAKKIAQDVFQRYYNDLIKKGVQIIENNVKIDFTDRICRTRGTLTVIQNAGEIQSWELQKNI